MALSAYAHAQIAPAPSPTTPPPRVPFSAFRMKPILDPKLEAEKEAMKASRDGGSLVVPDKEEVKAVPKAKVLGTLPIARPKPEVAPTVKMKVETVDAPPVRPLEQNIPLLSNDEKRRIPVARAVQPDTGVRISAAGVPLPPLRKPATPDNFDAAYAPQVEETLMQPSLSEIPIETVVVPQNEQEIVPPTPMTQEEIATAPASVRRNRFSSQSRTAGLDIGYGSRNRGADLPEALRNIRVGKLEQADGISPISIPGLERAAIPHAPDRADTSSQKVPPEVIVFFQENSDDLEVGQLEVLKADVVNLLQSRRDLDVEIVGYADVLGGNRDGAKKLSQERALMIREYLIRQKIDPDRVEVTSRANDTKIEPRDRADLFFSR